MHPARFLEWTIYRRLFPIGEIRQDWRHGDMMALLANINRDSTKRRKPFVATDFIRSDDEPATPKRKTWKEQKEIMFKHLQKHREILRQRKELKQKRAENRAKKRGQQRHDG